MNTMLDDIFMTMSTSTGLYPKLDLWTENKLQLQLHLHRHKTLTILSVATRNISTTSCRSTSSDNHTQEHAETSAYSKSIHHT